MVCLIGERQKKKKKKSERRLCRGHRDGDEMGCFWDLVLMQVEIISGRTLQLYILR